MDDTVVVGGVGMVKFAKPGRSDPYEVMASTAIRAALQDAGIAYSLVGQAYASYAFGDSACGQTALYRVGMTGIPVVNVNNNCSSGSSALMLARQAVLSGATDCALAFGFEQMRPGAIDMAWTDRTMPLIELERRLERMMPGVAEAPNAHRLFGAAATAYLDQTGADPSLYAKVAVKTRAHAINNPLAIFDTPLTVDQVMASPVIFPPYLRRLQACPPSCGAAAAVVCSHDFARRHIPDRAVTILAQQMVTDLPVRDTNPIDLSGADMTRRASAAVYEQAGIGPADVPVVELHDCFTSNEVITYEGLGLCGPGEAEKYVDAGDNTYGGRHVVNPSGGLMSKGHPLGATGLAQCFELVAQVRGEAGPRQVDGARLALQHNLGLGGACVVTLYGAG